MENIYDEQDDIAMLIYKHTKGELGELERNKLENWVAASAEHRSFFEEVTDTAKLIQELADRHRALMDIDKEALWRRLVGQGLGPAKPKRFLSGKWSKMK